MVTKLEETVKKEFSANAEIEVYPCIDSTNSVAAQRVAEGCSQWHTVVALSQTKGCGRLGRSFFSPEGTGLYMSTVLYPDEKARALLTGMAAVAVCEALEKELRLSPKIKWVNDILVNEKKVCGILAKGIQKGSCCGVILGIGINLYRPEGGFPSEIADVAGYLFEEREEGLLERLCVSVLESLYKRYKDIGCDDAPEQYRKRCATVGKEVRVIPAGGGAQRLGRALYVDDSYHITVEYDTKERETLSSGEVSLRF